MIDISSLLDTSFLIACLDSRDKNHKRAVSLLTELESGKYGTRFISDYIFDETITLLKKYVGNKNATQMGEKLLTATELVHISSIIFEESWELSKKFENLSFTDCSNLVVIKHHGINYIVTFDSGFKGIANVLD